MTARPLFLCSMLVLAGAVPAAAQEFRAIWSSSPNDVWIVGAGGVSARSTVRGWATVPTGTTNDLYSVWGSGPADVWAVGESGVVIRWNGSVWTRVPFPSTSDLIAVGGCSATDVWVLGQADANSPPLLARWDGRQWTQQPLTVAFHATGFARACPDLLVVGTAYFDPRPTERRAYGVLLRRSGATWTAAGWNGRAVTDPRIGNVGWSAIAHNGATTLLVGQDSSGQAVILMAGRIGGWRSVGIPSVSNTDVSEMQFAVAGDGSPIAVFPDGFARLSGGQWVITSAASTVAAVMPSAARQQRMEELTRQMQAQIAAGRAPTMEQMREIQEFSQEAQGQAATMTAASQQAQTLSFGRGAVVWAPAVGTDVFVLSRAGRVSRISGTTATTLYDPHCPACVTTGAAATPAAAPAPGRSNIPTPTRRVKP